MRSLFFIDEHIRHTVVHLEPRATLTAHKLIAVDSEIGMIARADKHFNEQLTDGTFLARLEQDHG
jgi:hypothetical protein